MNIQSMVLGLTTILLIANAPFVRAQTSYADVQRFSDESVVDGSSTLLRTDDGVAYTLNTRELTKWGAYTNWYVNFNNPEMCFEPCACGEADFGNENVEIGVFWSTGRVADRNGQAEFAAHTNYGELPDGTGQVPFAPDFANPIEAGAEIHIVVRSHGRRLRPLLEEQLATFNGGCPPRQCTDVQFAIHRSPTCVVP